MNISNPKIFFVTTCKGRANHLAETLPKNISDNPTATFVVVSYNCPTTSDYLRERHWADIMNGRLVVYQYLDPVSFRMAHAKNLAHRCGIAEGADIIVNVDADNYACSGFDEYLLEHFRESDQMFMWSRMIKDGTGRLPRGISGRIAVTKNQFLLVGGYDEKYDTHSPDDKDFSARISRIGFDKKEIDQRYLSAIMHNDKVRFREYPKAAFSQELEDFCVERDNTVVNGSDVGCGTVWRNFNGEPITIGSLPTRIFGIGLHKTATTSLHHAFEILGLNSGHWKNAHWAKLIWREMKDGGRSPTLEKHYALSDLPIPLMFRQLDRAYPGSKFILTVRDEWNWLKSVSNHWNPERNQYRTAWDSDPFSHKVHQLLYGRKDFDATTMLARYRAHNYEVMEYFKDRPQDLLVLDMEKRQDWKNICGFLGEPIPNVPYPMKTVTASHSK